MDIDITNLCIETNNKEILKDLNLNIKKGEIHVIMGPNGTGKSTLSKVIMGDTRYNVTQGDIICEGKSILNLNTCERAHLGIFLCFQNPNVIEGVTNSEFLKCALDSKTNEKIGLFDFVNIIEKNVKELKMSKDMIHRFLNENFSGGEKKKNEILQMKILKPKFIIFDELDSGLDVDSLKIVCDNINDYLKQNKDTSVLLITHYPRILEFIKPKFVHVLGDGRIIKTGDITLANIINEKGYNCANIVSEK